MSRPSSKRASRSAKLTRSPTASSIRYARLASARASSVEEGTGDVEIPEQVGGDLPSKVVGVPQVPTGRVARRSPVRAAKPAPRLPHRCDPYGALLLDRPETDVGEGTPDVGKDLDDRLDSHSCWGLFVSAVFHRSPAW